MSRVDPSLVYPNPNAVQEGIATLGPSFAQQQQSQIAARDAAAQAQERQAQADKLRQLNIEARTKYNEQQKVGQMMADLKTVGREPTTQDFYAAAPTFGDSFAKPYFAAKTDEATNTTEQLKNAKTQLDMHQANQDALVEKKKELGRYPIEERIGMIPRAVQQLTQAGHLTPDEATQFLNPQEWTDSTIAEDVGTNKAQVDAQIKEHQTKIEEALKIAQTAAENAKAQHEASDALWKPVGAEGLANTQTNQVIGGPKPPTKSFEEQTYDDFLKDATLTGKYGQSRIGFDKYKQDQQLARAAAQGAATAERAANKLTQSGPGDWTKTGGEFLDTIPAQWQTTVKKIANYDEDPTKATSMRGGMREQVMQWVNQVNPEYDSTLFGNRAPTRKAFTTGTQGQQINAMNTAIGHLDMLPDIAAALKNGSFVPGNELYNRVKTAFGAPAVTNFDTLKDALAGEVASVLSKGSATVSGIAAEKQKMGAANSPEQLAGYVKTLIPVMGSKLNALNYQYHQAMGANDPFSALSPESKRVLGKYGVTSDDSDGGGIAPEGTVITLKNGTKQVKRGGKWVNQ